MLLAITKLACSVAILVSALMCCPVHLAAQSKNCIDIDAAIKARTESFDKIETDLNLRYFELTKPLSPINSHKLKTDSARLCQNAKATISAAE